MKKKLLSLLLVGCMLGVIGCGSSQENDTKNQTIENGMDTQTESTDNITIKMASNPFIGLAPIYVAIDKGFFEEKGLDFSLVDFDDSSSSCSALLSNNVDLAEITMDAAIIAESKSEDTPLKVTSVVDESAGADGILATNDIKNIADLKGKTIGVALNQTSHYLLLKALNEAGVSESEVNLTDMTSSDAGVSFISGGVDAAVTWEPYLSNAVNSGVGHMIFSSADVPGTILDVIATKSENVDADWMAKFNEGYKAGLAYLNDAKTHEEAVEIVAKHLEVSTDDAESMLSTVHLYSPDDAEKFLAEGGMAYNAVGDIAQFYTDKGIISKTVSASEILPLE